MRILSQLIGFFMVLNSCDDGLDDHSSDKKLHRIFNLPGELSEASGMILYDSLLWTFNDSGNESVLFGIDTENGAIRKKITVHHAFNTDWEDIAQDDASIYIGDIGNGAGDRDTLNIYVLSKSELNSSPEQTTNAYRISFSFEDQTSFEPALYETSYDCEALICMNDSLYVFTKDWRKSETAIYSMPKSPGYYKANRITGFDVNGLVTGAGYHQQYHQIALCGYTDNYVPFITLIDLSGSFDMTDEEIIRYDFFEYFGVQIEGIDYDEDKLFLVSEKSAQLQAFFELR